MASNPPGSPPPSPWAVIALILSIAFLAVALAAAYLLWRDAPLPGAIEGQTLSWRFQSRGALSPPGEVAILAIDDATMAAITMNGTAHAITTRHAAAKAECLPNPRSARRQQLLSQ